jgi:23S rRNA (adenine1618-N6)-methyltransferase
VVQHIGVESLEPACDPDSPEKAGVLKARWWKCPRAKQSRFVAWTFQTKAQQQAWRQTRWVKASTE